MAKKGFRPRRLAVDQYQSWTGLHRRSVDKKQTCEFCNRWIPAKESHVWASGLAYHNACAKRAFPGIHVVPAGLVELPNPGRRRRYIRRRNPR